MFLISEKNHNNQINIINFRTSCMDHHGHKAFEGFCFVFQLFFLFIFATETQRTQRTAHFVLNVFKYGIFSVSSVAGLCVSW